jgi:hypothetical protein
MSALASGEVDALFITAFPNGVHTGTRKSGRSPSD